MPSRRAISSPPALPSASPEDGGRQAPASRAANGGRSIPLPARLIIPAIGVDAAVEMLGTTPDGAMEAPRRWEDVGWFSLGYRPGEPGNAVIAGHLDSDRDRAVFWDLNALQRGDRVVLVRQDASRSAFEVTSKQRYEEGKAPLERVFGPSREPRLNLVTCSGVFDHATQRYGARLVVYTRQAGDNPPAPSQ